MSVIKLFTFSNLIAVYIVFFPICLVWGLLWVIEQVASGVFSNIRSGLLVTLAVYNLGFILLGVGILLLRLFSRYIY
jgi:uncharacterized integral membrane protein